MQQQCQQPFTSPRQTHQQNHQQTQSSSYDGTIRQGQNQPQQHVYYSVTNAPMHQQQQFQQYQQQQHGDAKYVVAVQQHQQLLQQRQQIDDIELHDDSAHNSVSREFSSPTTASFRYQPRTTMDGILSPSIVNSVSSQNIQSLPITIMPPPPELSDASSSSPLPTIIHSSISVDNARPYIATTASRQSSPQNMPMSTNKRQRCRRSVLPPQLLHLEKMLDLTKFIEQLEGLIEKPIKIPGTLSMCPPGVAPHSLTALNQREKQAPGKAKRDLLSVGDIWESRECQRAEVASLYNVDTIGERKWLLNLLLEESDPDSGGDEQVTEEDLRELLKIHKKRRKFQKKYHDNPANSQYIYYGVGLISAHDRFPEHQASVLAKQKDSSIVPPTNREREPSSK